MSDTYLQPWLLPEQGDRPPDLYEGRDGVIEVHDLRGERCTGYFRGPTAPPPQSTDLLSPGVLWLRLRTQPSHTHRPNRVPKRVTDLVWLSHTVITLLYVQGAATQVYMETHVEDNTVSK